ncbi:MAG: hypothetical protein OXC01_07955 [Immundisolibacterales bacterium]|nr:hypothetical protein [Immundisolibacterales bacterium]
MATLVRILVPVGLALPVSAGASACAGTAAPAVLLVTEHHYRNHHRLVWLPRQPVYESVATMSIDTVGNPCRAGWVFFTERGGGKRQVHLFDDPERSRLAARPDGGFGSTGCTGSAGLASRDGPERTRRRMQAGALPFASPEAQGGRNAGTRFPYDDAWTRGRDSPLNPSPQPRAERPRGP